MHCKRSLLLAMLLATALAASTRARAAESFRKLVGPVKVQPVKSGSTYEVPFITWGGDVATFHANGGLKSTRSSMFGSAGLDLRLVAGDDFVGQVKRYLSGQSPFLRGTFRMLGMASEVIGADPRTKPVVFLQLTWSQGDHMVARPIVTTLDQLKGKKIALQQGGPHVGMLDDILRSAQLKWSDIQPVWAAELTGDNGPAAIFRRDPSVDACMVISPDMLGLSSGLEETGSGAEGTVKGARVVVSTFNMNRSIADVYACRKDFYDTHRDVVEKFTAVYLKACEDVVRLKKEYGGGGSQQYRTVLQLTERIYGSDVIPNEAEADGLISDCEYVHLAGNRLFFQEAAFSEGYESKLEKALNLAVEQGYAASRVAFIKHDLAYEKLVTLGSLTKIELGEAVSFETIDVEEEDTILQFTIGFEPNQTRFPTERYAEEFQRVVDGASLYGNSVFAIRGHADPTRTLRNLVEAGIKKQLIKRTGTRGSFKYFFRGKSLDLSQTEALVQLIRSGAFNGADPDPSQTMQAALNLSQQRAEEVKRTIIRYAGTKGLRLNPNQLQAVGAGIADPVIPRPRSLEQSRENMRVEFRLLRVKAEAVQANEFDF